MGLFTFLRSPRGTLKILEVLSSIVVIVLLYLGCLDGWKNGRLVTLGISGGFLIITADTIIIYIICDNEISKTHLEASISVIQSVLYLSVGVHQMRMAMWWSQEQCYTMTTVSGIFAIINTMLYSCDAFLTVIAIYRAKQRQGQVSATKHGPNEPKSPKQQVLTKSKQAKQQSPIEPV